MRWFYDLTCDRLINLKYVSELRVEKLEEDSYALKAIMGDGEEEFVVIDLFPSYFKAKEVLDNFQQEIVML